MSILSHECTSTLSIPFHHLFGHQSSSTSFFSFSGPSPGHSQSILYILHVGGGLDTIQCALSLLSHFYLIITLSFYGIYPLHLDKLTDALLYFQFPACFPFCDFQLLQINQGNWRQPLPLEIYNTSIRSHTHPLGAK